MTCTVRYDVIEGWTDHDGSKWERMTNTVTGKTTGWVKITNTRPTTAEDRP